MECKMRYLSTNYWLIVRVFVSTTTLVANCETGPGGVDGLPSLEVITGLKSHLVSIGLQGPSFYPIDTLISAILISIHPTAL
jgi:hypothetical protein